MKCSNPFIFIYRKIIHLLCHHSWIALQVDFLSLKNLTLSFRRSFLRRAYDVFQSVSCSIERWRKRFTTCARHRLFMHTITHRVFYVLHSHGVCIAFERIKNRRRSIELRGAAATVAFASIADCMYVCWADVCLSSLYLRIFLYKTTMSTLCVYARVCSLGLARLSHHDWQLLKVIDDNITIVLWVSQRFWERESLRRNTCCCLIKYYFWVVFVRRQFITVVCTNHNCERPKS